MSAAAVRKNLAFFAPAMAYTLAYRLDILMWMGRALFVFLATAWMWLSVYAGRSGGGYDSATIFTYVIVAATIGDVVVQDDQEELADSIVTGTISLYLVKPVSHFWSHAVRMIPVRLLVVLSAPLKLAVFALLFVGAATAFPSAPVRWALFVLSLSLAVVMFIAIDYMNGCLAFWFGRAYGVRWMITMLWVFLSGAYMPIGLLPGWIRPIVMATPFPYLVYAPAAQLVGPESATTRALLVAIQAVWVVVLYLLVRLVWRAGMRRYEAAGS